MQVKVKVQAILYTMLIHLMVNLPDPVNLINLVNLVNLASRGTSITQNHIRNHDQNHDPKTDQEKKEANTAVPVHHLGLDLGHVQGGMIQPKIQDIQKIQGI